jgi:hypothetical protein
VKTSKRIINGTTPKVNLLAVQINLCFNPVKSITKSSQKGLTPTIPIYWIFEKNVFQTCSWTLISKAPKNDQIEIQIIIHDTALAPGINLLRKVNTINKIEMIELTR